jgi:NAD(P)-dependent dehydrogenase (short-subunit alcohol dehydrogenase family)
MTKLKDRVAVVTGASSGIGEACARAFAAEGAKVVLAARRADRLDALVKEIEGRGGVALARATDCTKEADVEALFALVDQKFGRVDLLLNSAGIADHTPTDTITLARFTEVMDANLTSTFLCCRAAFIRMKAQRRGRIINIGSISAKTPRPNNIAYASSKFGMQGMTAALALDGREFGITASILHPGATITELMPGMADRGPRDAMKAEEIAAIANLMACLPDETNLIEALAFPIGQPFLGRG